MKFLRNLSIKYKLISIILLGILLVNVLVFVISVYQELKDSRRELLESTTMSAVIIGEYCSGPLDFGYKEDVKNILETLGNISSLRNATVYDVNGNVFASFDRIDPEGLPREILGDSTSHFLGDYLHVLLPIKLRDKQIGSIYLRASAELSGTIINRIVSMLFIQLGIIILSYLIALKLQGIISRPILLLRNATKQISRETDFSIRVHKEANDEIGELYDEFNNMLDQIEKREAEKASAEKALRQSEERYRQLHQNIPVGLFRQPPGPDSRLIMANSSMAEMFGYKNVDEFLDCPVSSLFFDPEEGRAVYGKLKAKGHIVAEELKLRKCDGTQFWGSISARVVHDEAGEVVFIDGMCEDITDRRKTEEALRNSEQILDSIVENVPDIIYRLDLDGNFLFVSDALKKYGYTPEELIGTSVFEIVHPDDREKAAYCVNERRTGDRRTKSLELRLLKKDRTEVSFEITSNTLKDSSVFSVDAVGMYSSDKPGTKSFICTQGVARDITERKKAELERENLENQLRQAQKMESVGRLAGGVAHDFNNMLSVILGHSEIALSQLDPAHPLYDSLQEIEKAGQRSADFTKQLLAFARQQTVAPKVLPLNETMEGMLNMLRRLIGEDIDLVWRPGDDLWPVKIDPSQIDQLLANLCVNARDAIGGVGKITIETKNSCLDEAYCSEHTGFLPGEYTMLCVSDSGCGMEAEVVENIFEPFFTTKGKGEGTGLGLSTVYGIVKQNNGFINVYSELNLGTTFNIYLPRHMGKTEQLKAEDHAPQNALRHEAVLLVEDEPAILKMGKVMLEGLGYRVMDAATPGEAITLAEQHSEVINLLITDVVMPEMNGRDLAVRLLTLYPNLKLLFMSGYTADVIAHQGVLDEGVHFLQKPFTVKSLAAKVREVLES